MFDEVVGVTCSTRDNARRRLTAAAKTSPGAGRQVAVVSRKQRASKYSYDARKVLQQVWAASGGQCGKYLAVAMATLQDGLERHGELRPHGEPDLRAYRLSAHPLRAQRRPRPRGNRPGFSVDERPHHAIDRLRRVKDAVDPTRLFRANHSVLDVQE